jgi:oligo-1,6-glucosidase
MTVGEGSGITAENASDYIGESRQEIASVYHFNLANKREAPFNAEKFRRIQTQWAEVMEKDCWVSQYLSNHDSPRQVSWYGNDQQYRIPSAKLLATLNHTTPGMPFVYQGEEIGMVNVYFDRAEDYNDVSSLGDYRAMVASGVAPEEALRRIAPKSRDNARTPYQWDSSENAGFTTGTPWLKVNPVYKEINLEADRKSPDSVFAYYQKLIALRKAHPALQEGSFTLLCPQDEQVFAYTRDLEDEHILVVCNMSGREAAFTLPEAYENAKTLIANCEGRQAALRPYEAYMLVRRGA